MAEQPLLTSDLLSYQVLANNIHFIRLEQSTSETVVSLMALMDRLRAQASSASTMHFLIDSGAISLPMAISIRRAFELEERHPTYPPTRVALLYPESLIRLLDTMLKPLLGKNRIRVFKAQERDTAMTWLLVRKTTASLSLLLELRAAEARPGTP